MSPIDPDRTLRQEKTAADAYRVRWFPAAAETSYPERARAVRRAFEDGEEEKEGGTVCHVWLVDPEETEWRELLPLLYADEVAADGFPLGEGAAEYGMFLFLTTHSLKSWDDPEPPKGEKDTPDQARHRTLKQNEFLIRAFRSYRLGRVVHWDRPDEPDALGGPAVQPDPRFRRLEQELHRFKKRQPEFRDLREGLRSMREDLRRLQAIALAEFKGDNWTPEVGKRLSATQKGEQEETGAETPDLVLLDVNPRARMVPQRLQERLAADRPGAFAEALRAVYQFGLRPHIIAEKELGSALPDVGQRGSILFHRDIDLLVTARGPENTVSQEALELRVLLQGRLWAYELLRDLSTWFAYAANDWARKCGRPLEVLVIDEVFSQAEIDKHSRSRQLAEDLRDRLRKIAEAFGPSGSPGSVHFDYVTADRAWDVYDHVDLGTPLQVLPLVPPPPEGVVAEPKNVDFFRYDLILVEVEFRGTYVGPAIVEKLSAHLEREAHARAELRTPAIIVLSQTANFNHVQQCLNLGAVAFVRKERMYELPTRVTRARIDQRAVEPQGQKANFRALYSLPHEDVSRLQSTVRDDCVLGVTDDVQERRWIEALPKADLHSHLGTHIDLETIQALSFNTVGHLLDRRAGNRDMAEGVDRLIDDVCRLVLVASRLHAQQRDKHPAVLLEQAGDVVLGGPALRAPAEKNGREPSPYERLIERLKARDPRINPFEITSLLMAVLMLVRARFAEEDEPGTLPAPLRTWEYVERLSDWLDQAWTKVLPAGQVGAPAEPGGTPGGAAPGHAAHAAAAGGEARARPGAGRDGRKHLDGWLALRRLRVQRLLGHISDKVSRRAEAVRSVVHRDSRMRPMGNTLREVHEWLEAWPQGADEERVFEAMRAPVRTHEEELRRSVRRIARRVPYAWWKLNRRLDDVLRRELDEKEEEPVAAVARIAMEFLGKTRTEREEGREELGQVFDPLTLHELVVIPARPKTSEKTLARYLWGADLLGADHLQYPENLLLAARSVVRQCTAENIWYTELRCETAGYTEGGMVAVDATDLLCTALDLAVAYGVKYPEPQADRQQRTRDAGWARFSILLGAKRHKTPERFKEIVGLATYYMQQRDEEELSPFAPIWWKPTSVAGFDLSGDENVKQERWRKIMKPLFKHSTPITIHAGEAADAESIWQAVYLYGARRIGHGLRLRENRRLLNHCISEGICMELCPISNKYTNSFPEAQDDYESDWWEYYPLRYYMEQGLDLCINTDNRLLHPEGGNTLTDEYLCAAQLVGGLSRWDVLRIVKAGFKHAFLPKREIGVLLRAVESQVYELVTDPDGEMTGSWLRGGRGRTSLYVGKVAKPTAPEAEPLAPA